MINAFSILVPIYNFNVVPLVEQLLKLAQKTNKPFEILLVDDFSAPEFERQNQTLKTKKAVKYIALSENIGRSRIRNYLFENAQYEHCIILDCDVLLAKENFLNLYLEQLTKQNVVVGGHVYLAKPPTEKSKYFHWLYGRKIEVKTISERQKNPYASFMTNSFAISKSLFNKLKFNESISEYGHEDTLFGLELKKRAIPIVQIYNPVVHLGLETETVFMQKQEKAIQNLVRLCRNSNYTDDLERDIKLVQFYSLFYNKLPYSFLIKILSFGIKQIVKVLPINTLKLSAFSFWKLEKFDFYAKKN